MSRNWNSGAHAYIDCPAGALAPAGTGAYTIATLIRPTLNRTAAVSLRNGGSLVRQLISDSGKWFGASDFTGYGDAATGTWQYVAQSKASGSNVYRWHSLPYGGDPAATNHADGVGPHPDGSPIDEVRIGDGDNPATGDLAVVAVWNRALSDSEVQAVFSPRLMDWAAKHPDGLFALPLSEAGNAVFDLSGHGANQTSVVGTITGSADPPEFQYFVPLRTPTVREGMDAYSGLWKFYSMDRGVSLAVSGTTVTQVRYPYQDDLALYDHFYMGGHVSAISPAEATILINAGYGAYLS